MPSFEDLAPVSTLIVQWYDPKMGARQREFVNVSFETIEYSHGVLSFEVGDQIQNFCSPEPFTYTIRHLDA